MNLGPILLDTLAGCKGERERYFAADVLLDAAPLTVSRIWHTESMSGMIRAPVEIWPKTRTAELLKQAYRALLADSLPDRITDPDALWECGYCSVRRVRKGQEANLSTVA